MSYPKGGPFLLRDEAVLLANSEYDDKATALVVDLGSFGVAEIEIDYLNNDDAGQCEFKILVASKKTGPFKPRTIDDAVIHASGGASYSKLYVSEKRGPVAADADDGFTYLVSVGTARFMKVLFREVGTVGSPGMLSAHVTLGVQG